MRTRIVIFSVLIFLLHACSKDDSPPPAAKSEDKQILALSFLAKDNADLQIDVTATIDQDSKTISANLPPGTALQSLVPTITVSTKAILDRSGPQNFSQAVAYTVTAEDGSSTAYAVSVQVDKYTGTQILSFELRSAENQSLTQDVVLPIGETAQVTDTLLPRHTDIKDLLPIIEVSEGATITPEGRQDFTDPVTYIVTAENGSSAAYVVTLATLNDRKILILLYNANPGNSLGWDISTSDIAQWSGVNTTAEGDRVYLLDLDNSGITDLPPEIGDLEELLSLEASFNNLSSLPPEIRNLQNVIKLNLSDNHFDSFPVEIVEMPNLQALFLDNNTISSLPQEINQMQGLSGLRLKNNILDSIPPEIGQLDGLTTLDLAQNRLKSLPDEIGLLNELKFLLLNDNELETVPFQIGWLTELDYLQLHNNELTSIPSLLGQLQGLSELSLRGNPSLTSIPGEVCILEEDGTTAIDIYPGIDCAKIGDDINGK